MPSIERWAGPWSTLGGTPLRRRHMTTPESPASSMDSQTGSPWTLGVGVGHGSVLGGGGAIGASYG